MGVKSEGGEGGTRWKGVDCYNWEGLCAGVEGSRVGCGAGGGFGCVREGW